MVPVEFEAFSIVSEGATLRGAAYFPSGGRGAAVCFCHGLPREAKPVEEKSYSALAERFAKEGFLSVIFNFQGTAGSGGFFSLSSWSRNLCDVLDYITSLRSVEPRKVFVVAFSMGAIAATSIAATDDRVSGFVCCSCPYNAEQFFHMLREGVRMADAAGVIRLRGEEELNELEQDLKKLNPMNFISKISPKPLLIVHGENDEIFPVEEAYKLFEAAKQPKSILILKGVGHHVRGSKEAINHIVKWLKEQL